MIRRGEKERRIIAMFAEGLTGVAPDEKQDKTGPYIDLADRGYRLKVLYALIEREAARKRQEEVTNGG